MEPSRNEPMHHEVVARVLPGLTFASITASATRSLRTRALIADGDDNVCLCWSPVAGHQVGHLSREWISEPNAGVLLSHADLFACTTAPGISRVINVGVPRKVMAAMVPRIEDRFMRPIPPDLEALKLLKSYLAVLGHDQALATPELRALVVTHVHDLMALALSASRDVTEIAKGRGLRAARLAAIKADIRASLGDQRLNLTAISARHRITPRYVQTLFEPEGTTFSQFLLSQRLARVHRMLHDPRQAGRSISEIAYDAGFGDLSYFNRAFRRHYGATPSDVRASAA
jgi:AraC-like DNA-binding protein